MSHLLSRLPWELSVLRPRPLVAVLPTRWSCASLRSTLAAPHARHHGTTAGPLKNVSAKRSLFRVGGGLAVLIAGWVTWWTLQEDERISPYKFTPLKIISVHRESVDTVLFKLALPLPRHPAPCDTPLPSAIQSLYLMQPHLQIQRPYTPLDASCFSAGEPGEIELLVKRYPNGELSRWLHGLGPGDEVRVRGPIITWDYRDGSYDEIVFIVGGTGITPAYQMLQRLAKTSSSVPKVSIIYASPHPSSILLKSSLDEFASKLPQCSVRYLVEDADKKSTQWSSELIKGRVQARQLKQWIGVGGSGGPRRVLVVCGPEAMVNAVAGPRARDLSQGPVGGILGELGYSSQEVVKL